MKMLFQLNKRSAIMAIAAMVLAGSMSAQTAPKPPVVRVTSGITEMGRCCFDWSDLSVRIVEPEHMVPIVVTWSTDYQANAPFYSGLRVNEGPCAFNGPMYMPTFVPEDGLGYTTRTVQWLFLPGDYKLRRGPNVITLCGGGVYSDTDTLTLGFTTLTVRLEK